MPSGPPELHEYWSARHPYGGDAAAIKHLEDRGYKLTKGWNWLLPDQDFVPNEEDYKAINYLCWEWDFGGLV